MAREIVAFCDHHTDTTGERVPAQTRQIDIGAGPRQVEICDECYDVLVTPLEKLLAAHGRDVSATGDHASLHCIWCRVTRRTVRGLQDHVNTEHPENAHTFLATLTTQARKSATAARKRTEEESESVDPELAARQKERESYGKVNCEICGKSVGKRGGLAGHMAWHRRQGDVR